MVGKEHAWHKELHAITVKMQGLEKTLKVFETITKWENIATKNQVKTTIYQRFVPKLLEDLHVALEEALMETKKWHFDHTKNYIEALDAIYVGIEKLEAKKEDTKIDEREEGDERERKGNNKYL